MALTSDQEQVRCLLEQAIPMLCKNGLLYKSEVCVQVLVGITLDRKQMIHFSFNETVRSGDKSVEQSENLSEAASPVRTVESSASDADDNQSNTHRRKSRVSRKRTRRSNNTSYVTETETSDVVREQKLTEKDQSQFSESSSSTGAVQCYPADDRALASTSASALPGSDLESGRTDQNDSTDPSVVVKSEDVIHIKDEPFDVEEITDQDEKNYIGDIASHPAGGYTSSFETYHSDPSAIDYQNPDGTNSMQSVSNVEKYYAESENYMLGTSQAAGDSILQPGTSADEPMGISEDLIDRVRGGTYDQTAAYLGLRKLPGRKEKRCSVCSAPNQRRRSRTVCQVCEQGLHSQCVVGHRCEPTRSAVLLRRRYTQSATTEPNASESGYRTYAQSATTEPNASESGYPPTISSERFGEANDSDPITCPAHQAQTQLDADMT